jgi:hypothetical protein
MGVRFFRSLFTHKPVPAEERPGEKSTSFKRPLGLKMSGNLESEKSEIKQERLGESFNLPVTEGLEQNDSQPVTEGLEQNNSQSLTEGLEQNDTVSQ